MSAENPDSKAEKLKSKPDKVGGNDTSSRAGEKAGAPEVGGREGPEPTRYGDWEKNGRCIDF